MILQLVDAGEASAIALALDMPNSILVLDDLKARKVAKSLDLRFTGTLGILVKAKQLGVVDSLKPILNAIQATNFRIPKNIVGKILQIVGE